MLYLPGLLLAALIAVVARFIEGLLPIPLISASVIALFLGMLIHYFRPKNDLIEPGVTFASKRVLKLAIILLGASLDISTIFHVGQLSIFVMFFTLLTCFGGGYLIGKALGLDWKLSNLISAGTGICGGSAIAAIAPVIEAKPIDVAFAMSATFIFDMFMIILFPIMGRALHLSDVAYGLWTGTAVNDTASVVAAGYAYSEAAGDFATMVKLTRTLVIIPTVIIFALVHHRMKQREHHTEHRVQLNLTKSFPLFIVFFLLMSAARTVGWIPAHLAENLKWLSKFLMVTALGAIGLNTSLKEMKEVGHAPMLHGLIVSVLVIIVAIGVEWMMGLV